MRFVVFLLVGFAVAATGILFRRLRARQLPEVPDALFLERFERHHDGARDQVLAERQRVASILSVPVQKLSPEQTLNELSRRFSFLADFSVAANDLYDEAAEMRELAGLGPRRSPPETIGEIIEDLVRGREASSRKQITPSMH